MGSVNKHQFKDYICRPFCMFFREGQKEAMACQGAQVIYRWVSRGRLNPEVLTRYRKHPRLWEKRDAALAANICKYCPFRVEDCDFTSVSPPPDCEPCGGYILISLLKENGMITSEDLEGGARG